MGFGGFRVWGLGVFGFGVGFIGVWGLGLGFGGAVLGLGVYIGILRSKHDL